MNRFVQKGSKNPEDSALAIERIREIKGDTEERCSPKTLSIGYEEKYKFLRDLRVADPERNSWIRDFPGDRHIMIHCIKVLSTLWWDAGFDFVAAKLGIDNKKTRDGTHYLRVHHSNCVTYEAIMNV